MEMTKTLDLKIYRTYDYSRFKTLQGNRTVSDGRVKKILKSINEVGYILNPIIINENGEVIDGQGRLEALKQLKYPVDYVIHPGAGIDECMAMNIHQTNWTAMDYFKSYAEQGNENYINFLALLKEYPEFKFREFLTVALGGKSSMGGVEHLIEGRLKFSTAEMWEVRPCIEYVKRFLPYTTKNGGKRAIVYGSIAWLFCNVDFDRERFYQKFKNDSALMPPMATREFAMQYFEKLYNSGLSKKSRVYFSSEYDRGGCKNET